MSLPEARISQESGYGENLFAINTKKIKKMSNTILIARRAKPEEANSGSGVSRRRFLFLSSVFTAGLIVAPSCVFVPAPAPTPVPVAPAAVVEVVKDAAGWWLSIDGQRVSGVAGVVYQPVPAGKHVFRDYMDKNDYASLYRPILDVEEGGMGHAKKMQELGIKVIRIYAVGTVNTQDIEAVHKAAVSGLQDLGGVRGVH